MALVLDGTLGLTYTGDTAASNNLSIPGNVGIGTASPGARLEVKGSSSDNATININNNSGNIWKLWNDNGASGLNIQYNGTTRLVIDASGNVGINTTVMNVFDAVAVNRPLVVARSDTSTSSIGSAASITISNLDTTTNNVSQINFAAITGANTNHFSSAIISSIHGARTNGQYPTGILTFSTSTALNNAPSEKLRITSAGTLAITQTAGTNTIDVSGNATSIANGGTVGFANASGMLVVNNHTNGNITIFLGGGGITSVVSSVGGQVGTFAYTSGNAGYTWTSNYGATATYAFYFLKTRPTA